MKDVNKINESDHKFFIGLLHVCEVLRRLESTFADIQGQKTVLLCGLYTSAMTAIMQQLLKLPSVTLPFPLWIL